MTSADLVVPGPDPNTPPAFVLGPPTACALDVQLAETVTVLDSYGYLLALVPKYLSDPARRRLYTIRSILESDRIALVEIDLPPLGLSMLAYQLRQLSVTDLGPGVLAGAARLLTYYNHCGAVLSSVAHLDRIDVGIGSHLRSWVPGAQFVVTANPTPRVLQLAEDTQLPAPQYLTHLAVAEGGSTADWIKNQLVRQWRTPQLMQVSLPADSPPWWGTQKLAEFAAYIPDVRMLYQLITSVRMDNCHCCGLEVIGDQCLFCSAYAYAEPI